MYYGKFALGDSCILSFRWQFGKLSHEILKHNKKVSDLKLLVS